MFDIQSRKVSTYSLECEVALGDHLSDLGDDLTLGAGQIDSLHANINLAGLAVLPGLHSLPTEEMQFIIILSALICMRDLLIGSDQCYKNQLSVIGGKISCHLQCYMRTISLSLSECTANRIFSSSYSLIDKMQFEQRVSLWSCYVEKAESSPLYLLCLSAHFCLSVHSKSNY